MDVDLFWRLVDSTRGQADRAEALAKLLETHTADEILRFRLLYDDLIQAANTVDLWAAAHTIHGGCTDGDFSNFREGLVELGRSTFEAAVQDPDSLADVVTPGKEFEVIDGLGNAPKVAWMDKTGETEEAFYEAVDAADERSDRGAPEEGEWWDFADAAEVRHRLPRLAAKFLADGGE
jgi:hypothetical protein